MLEVIPFPFISVRGWSFSLEHLTVSRLAFTNPLSKQRHLTVAFARVSLWRPLLWDCELCAVSGFTASQFWYQ